MLDLEQELGDIVDALTAAQLEYALCGGLAMAVHGAARATIDIDLLVREEDVERIREVVGSLGFTFRALPMSFAGGNIRIERVSKIDPSDGETLMLDLLLVTPELEGTWRSREARRWREGFLTVVSRQTDSAENVSIEHAGPRRHRNSGGSRMKRVDYSEPAIAQRIRQVSQLRKLCLSLSKSKPAEPPRPKQA